MLKDYQLRKLQPIQHLLDKMESKYRMQSEELGLTMTFDSNNDEQLWNYDMDRMDQVLTNLIDNATRYTQAGDSIKISIDEDSDFNILTEELQPIQHLLDKMESKYRMQSEELGLTMTFDSNNDEQLWNYDMDRMDQVLTNLIDNATRYTQAGDSIKISIDEDSDFNILTITDTALV